MKTDKLIRKEAKRILRKPKYHGFVDSIKIVGYQFDENFTTVVIQNGSAVYLGHAKCNPREDSYSKERGLSIALARAIDSAAAKENELKSVNETVSGNK